MTIKLESFAPLLQVFDMPRSVAFYLDAFGFRVSQQSQPGVSFDWCLLKLGEIELMLNTAYEQQDRPENPNVSRFAAHDDTGLFFGCRDLVAAKAHLCSLDVEVKGPKKAPYGMEQLWLKDPDGYVICLQWPAA